MYMKSTHIAAKLPRSEAIEAATKIVHANARLARTTRIASSRAT